MSVVIAVCVQWIQVYCSKDKLYHPLPFNSVVPVLKGHALDNMLFLRAQKPVKSLPYHYNT